MAKTSGSKSSVRKSFHGLLDCCCDLKCQDRSWSLLKYFRFALLALLVGAAGVLLVLRFMVTPQIKAYVEDARLTSFALANIRMSGAPVPAVASAAPAPAPSAASSAYEISISVALIVRNPNGAMTIKYSKPLVATFLFHDQRMDNVKVADEGHKHKRLKREVHHLHIGGEAPYVLDTAAVEEFKKQNATGVFKVEMRLSGAITLGMDNNRGLELSCPLMLRRPPPPSGLGSDHDVVVFHEVECKPDKPKKIIF